MPVHAKGNQHGGRKLDDLQNWLDMTSHENPLFGADQCIDYRVS